MTTKPRLEDYGLTGIDERPRIDVDSSPITAEEYDAALDALIRYQVETHRVRAFRDHLRQYEWEEYDRERPDL